MEEEILDTWQCGDIVSIMEKIQTKYGLFFKATIITAAGSVAEAYSRNEKRATGFALQKYAELLISDSKND